MRRLFGAGLVAAAALSSVFTIGPAAAAPAGPFQSLAQGSLDDSRRLDVAPAAVTGTVKWVVLRCAYQGRWPGSPFGQATSEYLHTMLSNTSPGLGAYWRKASYGAVTISHTVPGTNTEWRKLPHPNSAYGYVDESGVAHITASGEKLFRDCASVWNRSVTFKAKTYYALLLDQWSAYGGLGGTYWQLGMDGVVSVPGLLLGDFHTEETYWAHEMGHAFGLQHSMSQDDPYNIYDTAYDVMSSPGGECFHDLAGSMWGQDPYDPRYARTREYGCIPGQTLAWNKEILGWIPAARRYVNPGGSHTINVERLAEPVSTTRPLLAVLPVTAHLRYTVEARMMTGISETLNTGFDENFPARINGALVTKFERSDPRAPVGCVVINRVSDDAYAPVLMGTDGNHDGWWDDPGTCFKPGRKWQDPTGTVKVYVNSMGASSFNVTLTSP